MRRRILSDVTENMQASARVRGESRVPPTLARTSPCRAAWGERAVLAHLEDGAVDVLEDEVELAGAAEDLVQRDHVFVRQRLQDAHLPPRRLADLSSRQNSVRAD